MTNLTPRTAPYLAVVGALLLSACGTDSDTGPEEGTAETDAHGTDPRDEPLTVEEIPSVLLSYSDFPGSVDAPLNHFGADLFDGDATEGWSTYSEFFGTSECTEVLEDIGGVDGENPVHASGERSATVTVDEDEDEAPRSVRLSLTSYEEETSVEASWDEDQAACDGETLEAEDESWTATARLEPAEIGDFRGLREHWEWEEDGDAAGASTYHTLSYAVGQHVIRVSSDLDADTLADLLDQQVEQLIEGPASHPPEQMLDEAELPAEQLSSEELADLLMDPADLPVQATETIVEHGPDALDDQHLMGPMMAAASPAFSPEADPSDECLQTSDQSYEDLLLGAPGDGAALSHALEHDPAEDAMVRGALVLLQSYEEELDPSAAAGHWADLLSVCGQDGGPGASGMRDLGIPGVHGYTATMDVPEEASDSGLTEYSSHVAHVEFGHTSLRIIGFGISETEMHDLTAAQLERLQDTALSRR
ncbi:hypothetical protein [Nesterenkonia suensis]